MNKMAALDGLGFRELTDAQQMETEGGALPVIVVVKGYSLAKALGIVGGAAAAGAGAGYAAGKLL